MQCLKMPRNASFFLNRSSSYGREIIHFTFRFLIFSSLWDSAVQAEDVQETLRANCESHDIRKEGKKNRMRRIYHILVLVMHCIYASQPCSYSNGEASAG